MGITAEIYERLDRAEALKDLEPQDKGDSLSLICPSCEKREAYIYKNGTTIKCNRGNNCNYSASIFEYLKTAKGYTTDREVITELARLADYSLDIKDFDENKQAEKITRDTILENALTYFKNKLAENKTAKDYLTGRGYSEEEITKTDLGYLPSIQELKDYLVNIVNNDYSVNIVNIFSDNRLEKRIAIPYRDYLGRLQGFSFRALDNSEPKYLNSKGLKTSEQLFNIDKSKGEKALVITEGYLDSLIATARGLKGFTAIGKAQLSATQLDNAIKCGARHFVLALDQDRAGLDGTKRALEKINDRGAKGYVISLPEGYKDIDEYLKKHSIDELQGIIKNALSGSKWLAQSLLSKHSKQLTDVEKREVINEALSYEETLSDPIDSKDFIDVITQGLDIPLELLEPLIKDYHEKKATERQRKSFSELQYKSSQLLNEGKLGELQRLYKEELPSITAKGVSRIIEPYSLASFYQDIQEKKEGLKTGFTRLDKWVTIPQEAITIIAGRPSHGKTTLLLNMFLNFVNTYPDKRFFFFSYEETKNQLALKCLTILSGEQLDQYQNLKELENYIRQNKTDSTKIEEAKKTYQELTESGRLWLIEEPYYINDLTDTITYLTEKYNNVGAIFIDYLQKIKIKDKAQSRQVEIQRISEEILEVAKKVSLPILLGAQLNRGVKDKKGVSLSNLRESGDIEQDANLVLGLYNEAMEEAEDSGTELTDREINLDIKILKNRGGITGKTATLNFTRPLLTLGDKDL